MNAMVLDDYLDALLSGDAAAATAPAAAPSPPAAAHAERAVITEVTPASAPPVSPAIADVAPLPLPPAALPARTLLAGQMPALAALSPRLLPQPGEAASAHFRPLAEPTTRWLRMRCDQQQYALELLKVQEVVLPSTLLPLRGGPRHLLGVMNLRGQVVPVIDMGLFLDRAAVSVDSHSRIVVLEENGEVLGLQVSAVEDVANIAAASIEPPDHARICRISNHLFRGVARLGRQTVILLDASQLLA
nr:chemotaxis protein CheW [Pseudoxanthomonas dokdonensis]